ncbi:hypothetical protein [Rhizorhabdus histidinilytica]|uniref:hypothetical protein n=1 Tax=Rhizorhabdus histidinilytica TaxID=439228 RepID=UPI00321FC9AB
MTGYAKPKMPTIGDVPLAVAMVVWNTADRGGGAAVVRHPDRVGLGRDYRRSDGACTRIDADRLWADLGSTEQFARLMNIAWQAVVRDGVDPQDMHEALLAVPEFRSLMPRGMDGGEKEAAERRGWRGGEA